MKALIALAAALLTGCANYGEYYRSVEASNTAMVAAVRAQAEADAVRFNVLMRIAESGDATAKVAATMALALGGARPAQAPAVAQMPQNEALQWASILIPSLTGAYVVNSNNSLSRHLSDNATAQTMSTNQAMMGMGSLIADPPLVVTQPPPVIVPAPDPVIVNPVIVPQPDPILVPTPFP